MRGWGRVAERAMQTCGKRSWPCLAVCGHEVHWLQAPSHIGICGNHNADELANVGQRKSPLLLGHILVNMVGRVGEGEDEEEEFDKWSVPGMGEETQAEEEEKCPRSALVRRACGDMWTPIRKSPQMNPHGALGAPLPRGGGLHILALSENKQTSHPLLPLSADLQYLTDKVTGGWRDITKARRLHDPQSGRTDSANIPGAGKGIAHVPRCFDEPPGCVETRPYARFSPPLPDETQYE